jgi:hypothetical protein
MQRENTLIGRRSFLATSGSFDCVRLSPHFAHDDNVIEGRVPLKRIAGLLYSVANAATGCLGRGVGEGTSRSM